jgi:diguanylate cyclase (GGDEF)-like protein
MSKFLPDTIPKDPAQRIRLQRILMTIASYCLGDILVLLYQIWGVLRLSLEKTLMLFGISFALNLVFIYFVLTNRNLKFKDPSMTIPQMVVAAIFTFIVTYFSSSHRGALLLFFVFNLTFGFFKLKRSQFYGFGGFIVIGYAITLLLLWINHPEYMNLKIDILRLLVLFVVVIWFSIIGGHMHNLRKELKKAMKELREANLILKELSTTDELTKVKNRRAIMERLKEEYSRAKRFNYPLSVVIMDLDHFKSINDTHGHQKGDEVLRETAGLLKATLRETDHFGRFGGEEFLAVLTGTDEKGAEQWAERARQKVEGHGFDGLKDKQVTVSFGIAGRRDEEGLDELLKRADEALYRAKERGRNCVVVG